MPGLPVRHAGRLILRHDLLLRALSHDNLPFIFIIITTLTTTYTTIIEGHAIPLLFLLRETPRGQG